MVFSSLFFLCVFLPAFLICFYFSQIKSRKKVILQFSILFYAWGAPMFIIFLLASSVFDYFISKYLEPKKINRKLFLWASLMLNIALLAYFKYANFFFQNIVTAVESIGFQKITFSEVLLPIGISFFTFQKISYTMDVYSGKNKRLTNFWDYLLYIIMFPQLIAGPIIRYQDISNQIINFDDNKFNKKLTGLYRFIIGLSKKVLIANTFALIVEQVNAIGIHSMSALDAWTGALAYSFQIYFDFAGYSDMAIGLGLMIGFRFPENFNFPYLAKSVTEFWQRWHITLGTWMRDYLYLPLGGNRVSKYRTYFNLIFVFFISGFWHGANWNFIVWGLFHGLFLIIERAWLSSFLKKMPNIIQVFYTFFIVVVGWVFFSKDLDLAILFLKKMFSFSGSSLSIQSDLKIWLIISLGILFSFMAINTKLLNYFNGFIDMISSEKLRYSIPSFLIISLLLILSFLSIVSSDFNPFIYYRF